jgi:hypothetical protein
VGEFFRRKIQEDKGFKDEKVERVPTETAPLIIRSFTFENLWFKSLCTSFSHIFLVMIVGEKTKPVNMATPTYFLAVLDHFFLQKRPSSIISLELSKFHVLQADFLLIIWTSSE